MAGKAIAQPVIKAIQAAQKEEEIDVLENAKELMQIAVENSQRFDSQTFRKTWFAAIVPTDESKVTIKSKTKLRKKLGCEHSKTFNKHWSEGIRDRKAAIQAGVTTGATLTQHYKRKSCSIFTGEYIASLPSEMDTGTKPPKS